MLEGMKGLDSAEPKRVRTSMSALRSSGLFMNPNEPTASKIKGQEPFPAPTLFGVRIHPASIREWCGRHVLPGVMAERSRRLHRGRYIRALRSEEHTSELQSPM